MSKTLVETIKKLRDETGAGLMDVKKALTQAGSDLNKARVILRQTSAVKAVQKSERSTQAGLIESYVHAGKIGVLVELGCQTDFVARTSEFKALAHELALQVASMAPKNVTELFSQNYIKDESTTIKQIVNNAIAKLGENIQIKRFVRFELGQGD